MAGDNRKKNKTQRRITVVGIGASAGGIEALQTFFAALPPDLGLAYVVIVHLSPHHESDLAAILARQTKMDVLQVGDDERMDLKPNRVYVISPDRKLEIDDTSLGASPFDQPRGTRATIDVFFRSLAEHGDGFAVILSGGGSDGTIGARAVKEAGGVVLVQDPREATHDGMPRAVITADIADVVLPVRQLAQRLAELASQKARIEPLVRPPGATEEEVDEDGEAALKRIFDLVRARTGHDFANYKRSTILRRVARRMQLKHKANLEQYTALLKNDPGEVRALFDDLLISVTTFFRDPDAWEALRALAVGPLVESCASGDGIRVWVPGCATGEEAYTLAILFREEIARRDAHCELVIFASDVDEGALALGREGLYPAAVTADLTEAQLTRYFRRQNDHYRVTSELRDCVVFASHSVLRDPPFSKLNLISCRNLLIYLNRELQQQLQHVFRYALRDNGYLFIGISEATDADLFEPLDKQHRLFRARTNASIPVRLPQVSSPPHLSEALERGREREAHARRSVAETHVAALEELAPPSLLVDNRGSVLHLSESVGRYLLPRGGPPTQAVMELVRPELADDLRSGLHQAFEGHEKYLSRFAPVQFNGMPRLVAVLVQPRQRSADREQEALVTFLEAGPAAVEEPTPEQEPNARLVAELKEKLRLGEQRLEGMRLDHATAYEDLRAANEELQSLNEEYRSTTEELETSKEELQSVNEELQTVNHELKMKLEEVSRAKNDLENFMAATDIAILFLDRRLCIKRYTPPVTDLFSLKAHDYGRPIGDLTHNLQYDDLVKDALRVLGDLAPIEREVKTREGQTLVVRIRPYRTAEDKIDGVVVTFVSR